MNPFAEKYKTLDNARLLEIRNNPQNYQPLAIEAAETELQTRNLSDAELADAAAELKAEADDERVKAEKREQANISLKTKITSIAGNFGPWQPLAGRPGRVILFICVVQLIISLKFLWDGIEGLIFAVQELHRGPSVFTVLTLFFALFSLGGVWLFMRGRRTGWILLSTYLVFINLVWYTALASYLVVFFRDDFRSANFLVAASIIVFEAGFCTACTLSIYRKWMRELYEIDRFWRITTVCIGVLCWLAFYTGAGI
jgi:hypothetical protein